MNLPEWDDETRRKVLKFLDAIAEGYIASGANDRFALVGNPDYKDPSDDDYLCIDVYALRELGTVSGLIKEDKMQLEELNTVDNSKHR